MSDAEISLIIRQLDQLMDALRANVTVLQGILTSDPEDPGDRTAPA